MHSDSELTRRTFLKLTSTGIVSLAIGGRSFGTQSQAAHPELAAGGKKFRFAVFADSHICPPAIKIPVMENGERTLRQAVAEVNAMTPNPAFVVHLGDMTNVANPESVENWHACVEPLKMTQVLVHGNHDGRPPYDVFLAMQEKRNGLRAPFYSFDCGLWHFVVIPCNQERNNPIESDFKQRMFEFLEKDIEQSKGKPTIVFQHFHSMPMGTAQTEWYLFDLDMRKRLMDLWTRHGNVKWVFNGHTHNGIMASEKTSWSYRGINFINLPTITVERPYGEEHPGFESGLADGGFYTVVEVDGENVSLFGRLAGKTESHPYPSTFRTFTDENEPRLFHTIGELPALATLSNGDFASGLTDWQLPWRYMREKEPAYTAAVLNDATAPNGKALHLMTRQYGCPFWAQDEYYEAYQISMFQPDKNPQLSFAYKIDKQPVDGGGYIRLAFLRDASLLSLMMFYWGAHEENSNFYPRAVGHSFVGKQVTWLFFEELSKKKQGFFFRLPMAEGKWHTLNVDIADVYNRALGQPCAFEQSGANKIYTALGTWNDRGLGTQSNALFAGVSLKHSGKIVPSMLDDKELAVGPEVFEVQFATAQEAKRVVKEKQL
jgi:3',5'-cyclic AMP phosphodiesterase CpdA